MAFNAYDDHEQGERVQNWLRQNGLSIVVGIAIGLIAIFGYQQWRNHQAGHQEQAAELYQQLQALLDSPNTNAADVITESLKKDFSESPYALFAVSDQARKQVENKQFDQALASLDWAEQHASSAELKALVELRIAHVQLAKGDAQAAVTALDKIPAGSYGVVGQELRGDAMVKLGRRDDALKAYQASLKAMGEGVQPGNEVQMKIDDLATAGKQGA